MIDYFFSSLERYITFSNKEKQLFQERTTLRKFKSKEKLLNKGEVSDTAYFVISGVLRYYNVNEAGQDITMLFASENNFVSKINSYLNREPSDESIDTVTSGEFIEMKFKDYQFLAKEIPGLQLAIFKISNAYLIENYNFHRFLITVEAKDRYLSFMKKYPTILSRVPLSQIASFLGINQSTLSRIRKQVVSS